MPQQSETKSLILELSEESLQIHHACGEGVSVEGV